MLWSGEISKRWLAGVVLTTVTCFFLYQWTHSHQLMAKPLHQDVGERYFEELPQASLCLLQETCPEGPSSLPLAYRRRLAFTLAYVQRHIYRLAGRRAVVDAEWALTLRELLAELVPPGSSFTWRHSARLPDMGPAPPLPNGRIRHVCPEVYLSDKYDHPFHQRGMEPETCTYAPDFRSVLTAVLPAQSWRTATVNFVIAQIREHYDIPIIVLGNKMLTTDIELKDVMILRHAKDNVPEGESLNVVMRMVKTPYVFVGWLLAHFSDQSSLERLVRVMDELPDVMVAGGAGRDPQGRWKHGCLQRQMADYQASYTEGYYHSQHECMYCDDLLTPFAATTGVLLEVPFSAGLSGPAMYRDWFAHLREAGHLVLACPDVMFFLAGHVNMTKDQWLPVARRWALERIESYTGRVHSFSCHSVGISCKDALKIISFYLLPPCCRAIMERELQYLTDYGEANELEYELQAGSALAAVKMGSYLPWDFDQDLGFPRHHYKNWIAMKRSYLQDKKCTLKVQKEREYFTIFCQYFFLEFFSHGDILSRELFLPAELRDTPTRIEVGSRWTVVMTNPGLYARNAMGIDDLKHAAHWRNLNISKIGKSKGGYDHPGTWRPCTKPSHHSCQDRYPGDGNLPFKQPFLHL